MPNRLPPVSYELALSKGVEDSWRVTRVELREALNQPYRASVEAYIAAEAPELQDMLGCAACLTLSRGPGHSEELCGLVAGIDYLGYEEHGLFLRFHIVPAFELLGQRVDSRIWQELSVQDIVAELLDGAFADYERSVDFDVVSRGGRVRDYCVQYRESDRDFCARLLEEEGINYGFDHDPEALRETLHLYDENEQFGKLANLDGTNEVPIVVSNPSEIDVESIQVFEWSTRLTGTAVLRRDFDWMMPTHLVSASVDERDDRGRSRRHFDHGTRRFIHDELLERAKDLHASESLGARVVRGRSNVTAMRPGQRFVLRGHPQPEFDAEYLITEVVHRGAEAETSSSTTTAQAYQNHFECVPYESTLRPARRHRGPREFGPQTAIVTGPESEEIHTDEHGRIKVQFYWQEQPSYADKSSCWVRCSQSWAGVGWGTQFIPRVGMEVVVEFLEGNPDRPLVTGCVYNGDHPPPFALPENKTQSGWRSDSSPGGGGANELRFEDAAGNEEIYLHGEKDWRIEIENDKAQQVGRDETLRVGKDRSKTVVANETWQVMQNQVGTVGLNQSLSVALNQANTIGQNRADAVGQNASLTVGLDNSLTVGQGMSQSVAKTLRTSVGEDAVLDVGKDARVTVGGDRFVDSSNSTIKTREDMSFTSDKQMLFESAEGLRLDGQEKVLVQAADKLTFKCGDASITLAKDGKVVIKGKDIKIKGSGSVSIKGQQVGGN